MGSKSIVVAFRGSFQPCLLGSFRLLFQTVLALPAENVGFRFPGRALRNRAIHIVHNFFAALTLHDVRVSAVRRWEPVGIGITIALCKQGANSGKKQC